MWWCLVVSTVNDLPHSVCSAKELLLASTVPTVPVTDPNCGGVGADGSEAMVTPLAAARLTERSVWMTVLRWKSTRNPSGEVALTVTGNGAVVKESESVLLSNAGESWQTLPTAQLLPRDESD